MNKHIGLFIAAAVFLLPVSAQSQTAKDIEGCWSLMSFVIERKGGDRIEPFGPKPIGQYIYTADKHATIFQMRPDLPAGVSGDPKSATDPVVQTYVVYFGPYTLEGKTLTVNIGNGVTRGDWRNSKRVNTIEKVTPTELVLISETPDLKAITSLMRCSAR